MQAYAVIPNRFIKSPASVYIKLINKIDTYLEAAFFVKLPFTFLQLKKKRQ